MPKDYRGKCKEALKTKRCPRAGVPRLRTCDLHTSRTATGGRAAQGMPAPLGWSAAQGGPLGRHGDASGRRHGRGAGRPKDAAAIPTEGDCCWIDGQISVGFSGLLRPHQMLMEKKMLRFKRVLGWRSGNPPKTRSQANGVQNRTTVACPGKSGRAEQQRDQRT